MRSLYFHSFAKAKQLKLILQTLPLITNDQNDRTGFSGTNQSVHTNQLQVRNADLN
ncbi:hypothetical protein SAMN05192588_1097 [Nonlabens sp. Hel1_33_55]|nr:hypothetical protein SAMN05192588_1097 [Nonlabens sp. Hel1_33_55]